MSQPNSGMERLRDVGITVAAAILVAGLTPVWLAHDAATRLASRSRRGRVAELERRPASTVEVRSVLTRRTPVIVEGLGDQLGLADAATPDALTRLAGDVRIGVALHAAESPFFLYSGGYGARVVEQRTMTVAEFVDLMFEDGVERGQVVYRLLGPNHLDGKVLDVLVEFESALRAHGATGTEPRFSGVWIGSPGVTTPLHHDAWPGLLFQTYGRKRVAMYSPQDRTNLYFRSPLRGAGRWSRLPGRSAEADLAEFPRFGRATRWEGELRPGDALFIPPYWAHEMEAIEANISVPFRFTTPRRGYVDPGFLRPATEILRRRLDRTPAQAVALR